MALAILLATGKLGILFRANIMLTWLLFTPATVAMEEMEGMGEIGGTPLPFPTFAVDMVVVMVAVVAVIKLRRGYLLARALFLSPSRSLELIISWREESGTPLLPTLRPSPGEAQGGGEYWYRWGINWVLTLSELRVII